MTAVIQNDEMFLDLLRETIIEAIEDSEFEIEVDNGCRHGCCPTQYEFIEGTRATEFADDVI